MNFLDLPFMFDSFVELCRGIPLTLQLMALSVISGAVLATILATMRLSGNLILDLIARGYIFVLRGTPLLVQLYIIYYGLSQFPELRRSFLWPFLREPYWCAVLYCTQYGCLQRRNHTRRRSVGRDWADRSSACLWHERLHPRPSYSGPTGPAADAARLFE